MCTKPGSRPFTPMTLSAWAAPVDPSELTTEGGLAVDRPQEGQPIRRMVLQQLPGEGVNGLGHRRCIRPVGSPHADFLASGYPAIRSSTEIGARSGFVKLP